MRKTDQFSFPVDLLDLRVELHRRGRGPPSEKLQNPALPRDEEVQIEKQVAADGNTTPKRHDRALVSPQLPSGLPTSTHPLCILAFFGLNPICLEQQKCSITGKDSFLFHSFQPLLRIVK